MKRGKKLFSLLLALLLILGATYGATLLNSENAQDEAEEAAVTVFALDPDAVTYISLDYYEPVSFEKQDGQWVYTGDGAFPLDSTYIEEMLNVLTEVTAYRTIEAVQDWDQYTLEAPYCQISLTADGVGYTLKIGEESALGGQRYFSTGDGNAYLVDAAILDAFSYALYDLLALEPIPDLSDVTTMEVVSAQESYTIAYRQDSGLAYSDEYVWFMGDQPLDTDLTEALLSAVTGLQWIECVDFHAGDLSAYGLETPDAVITVTCGQNADSGEPFVLQIGAVTGDYRYARIAGSQMVYKINASVAETLMYTTYYELQPDEVLLMDWDRVTGLDITLDETTYTFTKAVQTVTDEEGNETEETVYTLNDAEVDLDTVTGILDTMGSAGYAAGLTPERAEEIRIVIRREHDTFPEVTLAMYQYDSAKCLVTLNGAATVFVSRENVVTLVEKVNSIVLDG